jgi:hypothetical protein
MERNRLTLVAAEDEVVVPSDDATSPPPVLTTQEFGTPTLHLVRVDEGSLPDDAA